MTGLTREQAARAVAALFGTTARRTRESVTYDPWEVFDNDGKKWRFVYDGSISAVKRCGRERLSTTDTLYKVELNSPVLQYSEMEKLQQVIRTLRHAGAIVNTSCGMHVHVDAAHHTPQSLKNALSIMYSKEDILFAALEVNESRVERWCKKVEADKLVKIRKLPSWAGMNRMADLWYADCYDSRNAHYNQTRYHALNLHSVFYHGTLEWRCFNSTLHAGEVKANIILALAISAQAINQTVLYIAVQVISRIHSKRNCWKKCWKAFTKWLRRQGSKALRQSVQEEIWNVDDGIKKQIVNPIALLMAKEC